MFGQSVSDVETKILELWRRESELTERRQSVLGEIAKAERAAGEMLIDGEQAGGAIDALARLRAEVGAVKGGIVAARERRRQQLEKRKGLRVAELQKALDAKRAELENHTAKVEALVKQVSELEGVQMAATRVSGYDNPRSGVLASEAQAAETTLRAAEGRLVDAGGTESGATVEDIISKFETKAATSWVPSEAAVREWAQAVEDAIPQDHKYLLKGRNELELNGPRVIGYTRNISGGADRPTEGYAPPERKPVYVPYKRLYTLAWRDGQIDVAESNLAILDATSLGYQPMFRAKA